MTGCDFYGIYGVAHQSALGANMARIDAHCADLPARIKDPAKKPAWCLHGWCLRVGVPFEWLGKPTETVPPYADADADVCVCGVWGGQGTGVP